MIGLVPEIHEHGQLLRRHLLRDLLQHPGRRALLGQGRNNDFTVFQMPDRPGPHATPARLIDRLKLLQRGDDLRRRGEVRALHEGEEIFRFRLRILEQVLGRGSDLSGVVRGDIGGHAHGNARRAVQQHHGKPGRQGFRFV